MLCAASLEARTTHIVPLSKKVVQISTEMIILILKLLIILLLPQKIIALQSYLYMTFF